MILSDGFALVLLSAQTANHSQMFKRSSYTDDNNNLPYPEIFLALSLKGTQSP